MTLYIHAHKKRDENFINCKRLAGINRLSLWKAFLMCEIHYCGMFMKEHYTKMPCLNLISIVNMKYCIIPYQIMISNVVSIKPSLGIWHVAMQTMTTISLTTKSELCLEKEVRILLTHTHTHFTQFKVIIWH